MSKLHYLCYYLFLLSTSLGNVFLEPHYVNPSFTSNLKNTIQQTSDSLTLNNLRTILNIGVGSAFWIDKKSKIKGTTTDTLEGILLDASKYPIKQTVVFIHYDLPNRDCNARASNGEICCEYNSDGTCDYRKNTDNCNRGLNDYTTNYVDPFVSIVQSYQEKVNIVIVIEPDSLPNLVTNLGNPSCGNLATQTAYKKGISYVIQKFNQKAPKAILYVDAGHGGWLGWDNNARGFSQLIQSLNILNYIKGFSTNVANYQPIGIICPSPGWCLPDKGHSLDPCCSDPCKLTSQYNPCTNELNYVQMLSQYFPQKTFIIDSGRSGVPRARQDCANWCNPRNTGIGLISTGITNNSLVDSFFWLKTPGESDGCTQQLPSGLLCPRFDSMCASLDSIGSLSTEPRAPEAGSWWTYQMQMLARNANLGLPTPSPPTPSSPTPSPPTPSPPTPSSPTPSPPTPSPPTPSPPTPSPPTPSPPTPSPPTPSPPTPSPPTPSPLVQKYKMQCSECTLS